MTQELKEKALDILNRTTVDGPKLRLPEEEIDTEVWSIVKDALSHAGAQYNKKTKVFVSTEPIEALANAKAWLQEQETVTYDPPVLYDGPIEPEVEEEATEKKPDSVTLKKETRSLRYDYTPSEIYDIALKLAEESSALAKTESEKKAATAQFGARIKKHQGVIAEHSVSITNGYEYRDVDVEIHYNKPNNGKKTIIRTDNNAATVEKMEAWEFNLWNQPAEGVEA